jgi:predicted nucleic acid-binding protein
MKYLIATSTCLHIAKNETALCRERFRESIIENISVALFTAHDLVNRAKSIGYPSANAARILEFLSYFQILEYDTSTRDIYTDLRGRLGFLGKPITDFDWEIMSAAIAAENNLIFVTSNAYKFAGIDILKTEQWN